MVRIMNSKIINNRQPSRGLILLPTAEGNSEA